MLAFALAKQIYNNPLAVSAAYRATLDEEPVAQAKHQKVKPIRERRQAILHDALRGRG